MYKQKSQGGRGQDLQQVEWLAPLGRREQCYFMSFRSVMLGFITQSPNNIHNTLFHRKPFNPLFFFLLWDQCKKTAVLAGLLTSWPNTSYYLTWRNSRSPWAPPSWGFDSSNTFLSLGSWEIARAGASLGSSEAYYSATYWFLTRISIKSHRMPSELLSLFQSNPRKWWSDKWERGLTMLNGAHLHLIWKEASHSDGTSPICVGNFSHPSKLMPQEILVNFLLSVSVLSVHSSGPSPWPEHGAENKGNAQIDLCAQLPALVHMFPKAEPTSKAVQNSPCWQ